MGGGIETAIAGVGLYPLRVVSDKRGAVLHMLREDNDHFSRFGEVYFSEVYPAAVKGWKRHRRQTQSLAVPVGEVRFILQDPRPGSSTRCAVATVDVGRDHRYCLLVIPPGIWYAFFALSPAGALVANCADLPHDPAESEACGLDDPERPIIPMVDGLDRYQRLVPDDCAFRRSGPPSPLHVDHPVRGKWTG